LGGRARTEPCPCEFEVGDVCRKDVDFFESNTVERYFI